MDGCSEVLSKLGVFTGVEVKEDHVSSASLLVHSLLSTFLTVKLGWIARASTSYSSVCFRTESKHADYEGGQDLLPMMALQVF